MTVPYLNRLIVINEMLRSPHPHTIHDAYDLLFELWFTYGDDPVFKEELNQITREHPMLLEELEIRSKNLARPLSSNIFEKNDLEKMEVHVPKIFITYSHKDEKYKDELITMLIPLQDQDILRIWQDREIASGDEWYDAIQTALNTCDLGVLLVSPDFLASRFIRDEVLLHLIERRKEEGLRVLPIIIRQCMWQSIPVLKDSRALPKDGKPVITFKGVGERDNAWTEIARKIEGLAKEL